MNYVFKVCFLLLTNLFVCICNPSFSQDTIVLSFKEKDFKLEKLPLNHRKLKQGESYKLKIKGVNSAHIKASINPKSFNLQSNIPEPLKPLFPGIITNPVFNLHTEKKEIEKGFTDLFNMVSNEYKFLENVRKLAKDVYDSTKFNPSKEKLNKIAEKYPVTIDSLLINKVKYSLSSISYAKEIFSIWFNGRLESSHNVNANAFEIGNFLQNVELAINENDYLGKAIFLESSMKAKSEIPTTGFKALKDGVDLQISIIDTYKKDTLYKGEIEFINYKKWSFDFSTGFVFNQLVDVPYYLGPVSYGKKQVIEENYSNWDIAIGGFAHLTYKMSGFVSFGPQVGIGISILDAKPKYALGAGFLLGRKGKFSINGGVAFGKVKILSSQLEEINGQYFLPESATAVPTFDRMEASPYFSIAYNLTKKSF
ncbi:hypothetical protein [Pararhodonellum marinum]|uniref:hypothetical protein n=1 Tax=Pararhodonellum marinum TaxID=2755358 RepID=UPI00188F6B41|nr:hypothetical protein [Pararhodonellum marinum]